MKRLMIAAFLIAVLVKGQVPVLVADELQLNDFAGAMVYSGKEGSLLSLEIPPEVYQNSRQRDFGDLRIFDASQKPVPFAFRDIPNEYFTPPPEEVPFFIWNGGKENNFPANTDIEINTSGGVVRIKNQSGITDSPYQYLVDLSTLEYAPSSLQIKTENVGRNFNAAVSFYHSGDLSDWIPFNKRQVLASFGGNVQDTLELPGTGKYLLVGFDREIPTPESMIVYFSSRENTGTYHEASFPGLKSPDGKKVNYNLKGYYPAETIDFVLPEADSIPVLIKNRYSENDEWNVQAREIIFRYNSAGSIAKNLPFKIPSQAPYWELEAAGELLFSSAPLCIVRWKPRELVFPARGEGPWTLAFGNAACRPLDSADLLPLTGREETEPAVFTGEQRFTETELSDPVKHNYPVIILWGVLGAAVIILFILAFSIAKAMRK